MIRIISGTNRPGSRTRQIAGLVQKMYISRGVESEIVDLCEIGLEHAHGGHYGTELPETLAKAIAKVTSADGIVVITPEYNGSMPGALKYFIDFWKYPDTFEQRPVAFIGLGGKWGGLRPVEHLQGVFGYRNAFIFPVRVFLSDIWNHLKDGELQDKTLVGFLEAQTDGFVQFLRALKSEGLDANSRLAKQSDKK